MYNKRNESSCAMSETGPTTARRPSLRAKLPIGRAASKKPCRTTRPIRSGRTWNLEPPRGRTKVVTRLIVANTTTSAPSTKGDPDHGVCFLHDRSAARQGYFLDGVLRRQGADLAPCRRTLNSPLHDSRSGPEPLPLPHGQRPSGARRSMLPRSSRPARRTRRGPRCGCARFPASISVSRTWRCDMRKRVMTGTLAVVNKRVLPPTVAAPGDDTPEIGPVPLRQFESGALSCPRGSVRSAPPRRSRPRRAVAPSSSSTAPRAPVTRISSLSTVTSGAPA